METKEFVWKAGTQFPVDAKVAVDTICGLQKSLGKETITAKELLDASRDETAPLHLCFEWNNTVAAEQYRTYQARHIINSIEIRIIKGDTPSQFARTRYFLNVVANKPKNQGQFATIDVAFANDDYRNAVLKEAYRELNSFQLKYNRYQELSDVFKAIDSFGDALK